jgi:hypothetical protein
MAGKFSIYKYVKIEGKGWRYARAAYHANGKIKPNIVLAKGANGNAVEEKHPEGSYFLNFNNNWIPAGNDASKAQHKRKLKLNQVEYERLSGKSVAPGPNLVQFWEERRIERKTRATLAFALDKAATVGADRSASKCVPERLACEGAAEFFAVTCQVSADCRAARFDVVVGVPAFVTRHRVPTA